MKSAASQFLFLLFGLSAELWFQATINTSLKMSRLLSPSVWVKLKSKEEIQLMVCKKFVLDLLFDYIILVLINAFIRLFYGTVTIFGNDGRQFIGYYVQARDMKNSPIGMFNGNTLAKTHSCGGIRGVSLRNVIINYVIKISLYNSIAFVRTQLTMQILRRKTKSHSLGEHHRTIKEMCSFCKSFSFSCLSAFLIKVM